MPGEGMCLNSAMRRYIDCYMADGIRHPATSVAIVGDAAVFGFTTGHIQVYRLLKPSLAIEIAAHTRCITAVDGSSHLHKVRRLSSVMLSISFICCIWPVSVGRG